MAARAAEFGPVYHEKIMNRSSVIVSDPMEYAKVPLSLTILKWSCSSTTVVTKSLVDTPKRANNVFTMGVSKEFVILVINYVKKN